MKGHIRERSPGKWAIVIDFRDATGKRKRRWHSFRGTKKQAQTECSRQILEAKDGIAIDPTRETLGAFLERWLAHIKTRVSPRSCERYAEIARKNVAPLLGGVYIAKLTSADIDAAYAKALSSGRRDGTGGLSPRTVTHMHRVLSLALKQALKWRLLRYSPAAGATPPRVTDKRMNTYSVPQTAELLAAVRGQRIYVPAMLAVLCGLRRGEISALKWGAVDLDRAQLAVAYSMEQLNGSTRLKEPKTGRSRTIALSATVVEELRRHRLEQAQELLRLGVRLSDDSFVCALAEGSPMQPTFITHEWVRVITGTTLPRVRFHDLRHAHATAMLSSGIHPKIASERLGHSKVSTTLDIYQHCLPGMQEEAAATLDAAFREAQSKGKW